MKQPYSITLLTLSLSAILLTACGGGSSTTTVVKKDTMPPSITLKGANPLQLALNTKFSDLGATALDNIDGDISKSIKQTNSINMAKAACYTQTYQVSDKVGNKASAQRTVLVGNDKERHTPNHPPVAKDDSPSTIYTQKVTFTVTKNDTDTDCDTLKVLSITQPATGTAILNKNGSITFDPKKNVGSFFFKYTVSDQHGGTSTSGISVASHNPDDGNDNWPNLVADKVNTPKGTAIFIDVLANDVDADKDTLIIDMIDKPNHGTTKRESGGIIYTPTAGYTGTDSFYYSAHDGHGHSGATQVNITVTK